jgi:hypothetical protein
VAAHAEVDLLGDVVARDRHRLFDAVVATQPVEAVTVVGPRVCDLVAEEEQCV